MEGQAVPPKADTCPLTSARLYVVDAESVVVWKAWHRDLLLLPEPVKNWPPAQTVREFWLRQEEKQAASRTNPSSRRRGEETHWAPGVYVKRGALFVSLLVTQLFIHEKSGL